MPTITIDWYGLWVVASSALMGLAFGIILVGLVRLARGGRL